MEKEKSSRGCMLKKIFYVFQKVQKKKLFFNSLDIFHSNPLLNLSPKSRLNINKKLTQKKNLLKIL